MGRQSQSLKRGWVTTRHIGLRGIAFLINNECTELENMNSFWLFFLFFKNSKVYYLYIKSWRTNKINLMTYFEDSGWRTYPSGLGRDIDKWMFSVKIVQRQQWLVVLGWLMSSQWLRYLLICKQFAAICILYSVFFYLI